jgi:hypothetical protein
MELLGGLLEGHLKAQDLGPWNREETSQNFLPQNPEN